MLCKKPFLPSGQVMPVPCGQCMPCRIQHRRLWLARLTFESMKHSASCFVTLTYSDKELPVGGNLVPAHVVSFLKRLRSASSVRFRYFLVGEYGTETLRPHYHALLFGMPLSVETERLVSRTWGHGFVSVGDVSVASMRYVLGYTIKKMTRKGPEGRVPEFARMSRHPGIGSSFALELASCLRQAAAAESVRRNGVPSTVKVGGREVVLGRYLRQVVADELGIEKTSLARREAMAGEVFDVLARSPPGTSVCEAVQEPQRAASLVARERIFSSRSRKL